MSKADEAVERERFLGILRTVLRVNGMSEDDVTVEELGRLASDCAHGECKHDHGDAGEIDLDALAKQMKAMAN